MGVVRWASPASIFSNIPLSCIVEGSTQAIWQGVGIIQCPRCSPTYQLHAVLGFLHASPPIAPSHSPRNERLYFVSFHCTCLGQHNAENFAQSHLEGAVYADGVEGNEPFWWARNDDLCGLAPNTCCLKFDQCHKEQHMISRPPGTSHCRTFRPDLFRRSPRFAFTDYSCWQTTISILL